MIFVLWCTDVFFHCEIGDSGVGKTCLLLSFTTDEFDSDSRSTIGVDLKVKIMNVKNQKVKLTIWDTGNACFAF